MSKTLFFIESTNELTLNDYRNLRKFYLPIIGTDCTILYEYFQDLNSNYGGNNLFSLEEIEKQLKIQRITLQESLEKLEAVGLIDSYKKNNYSSYIYVLLKPNDIEKINNNPILKNHLIKMIGQNEYEKIYHEKKPKINNKYNYKNISKRYQDVFPENFQENILKNEEIDGYTTLELTIDKFESHEENVAKLPSTSFIKYLLNRNPNYYDNQLINSLLKIGFLDPSINLLIDFSINVNGDIVHPYIIKIAQDFIERSIIHFSDIKNELSIIEIFKKNQKRKRKEFANLQKNINVSNSKKEKISLEEIFNDDEIEGIF